MKVNSLLALAMMLLIVLACEPSSNTNRGREDYGPTRNPYENQDNYQRQQQGSSGPCNPAFEAMHAAYFETKNGKMPIERYRQYEAAYDECVRQNYPR